MRPEAEISGIIWDALQFARNTQLALGGATVEQYLEGGPLAWATERQIELLGESLGKLRRADTDIAGRIPDVHKIIAMRNILIHGYLIVNNRIVWLAATQQVPSLIPVLEQLLTELDSGASDQT